MFIPQRARYASRAWSYGGRQVVLYSISREGLDGDDILESPSMVQSVGDQEILMANVYRAPGGL
jgi:hypothetical protein